MSEDDVDTLVEPLYDEIAQNVGPFTGGHFLSTCSIQVERGSEMHV